MSNAVGSEETALIERACHGELAAFDQLVLLHQQEVFAVAVRMLGSRDEAQDIAQETFVRAYRAIGAFRQEAKLSTWLVSIAMNLCRNRRRWWARQRRVVTVSLDEPVELEEGVVTHDVADPAPLPSALAERRERERYVMAALKLLDEADRTVIVLRDLQGYSYEEIAGMLGIPLGTVKSKINRARWQLRALLNGKL